VLPLTAKGGPKEYGKQGDPFDVEPERNYQIEQPQPDYRRREQSGGDRSAIETDFEGAGGNSIDWADVGEYLEEGRSPATYRSTDREEEEIPTYTSHQKASAKDEEKGPEAPDHDEKTIEIVADDPDGTLQSLLEVIKNNAGIGHSFPVVVDPDDTEYFREFFIDGDGAFRIKELKTAKEDTVVTDSESDPMDSYEYQELPIVIENSAGSVRSWQDRDGNSGETEMIYDYGFIDGYHGVDGDEVDVYIGPNQESEWAYVIHQMATPEFVEHDEDKVMLGFDSEDEAKEAYLHHFNKPDFYGGMTAMKMDDFKLSLEENASSESDPSAITHIVGEAMKTAMAKPYITVAEHQMGWVVYQIDENGDPQHVKAERSKRKANSVARRVANERGLEFKTGKIATQFKSDEEVLSLFRRVYEETGMPPVLNVEASGDGYFNIVATDPFGSHYVISSHYSIEEAKDAQEHYDQLGKNAMKKANRPSEDLGAGSNTRLESPETSTVTEGDDLIVTPGELPSGYQGDDDPVKVALIEAGLLEKNSMAGYPTLSYEFDSSDAAFEAQKKMEAELHGAEQGYTDHAGETVHVYDVDGQEEFWDEMVKSLGGTRAGGAKTAAVVGHEEYEFKKGDKVTYTPTGRTGKITVQNAHVYTVEFDDDQNPNIRNVFAAELEPTKSKTSGLAFIKEMAKIAMAEGEFRGFPTDVFDRDGRTQEEMEEYFGPLPSPMFPDGVYEDRRNGEIYDINWEKDPHGYMAALDETESGSANLHLVDEGEDSKRYAMLKEFDGDNDFGWSLATMLGQAENVTRNTEDLPAQVITDVITNLEKEKAQRVLSDEEEAELGLMHAEQERRGQATTAVNVDNPSQLYEQGENDARSDVRNRPEASLEELAQIMSDQIMTGQTDPEYIRGYMETLDEYEESYPAYQAKIATQFDREMGLAQHEVYDDEPQHINADKIASNDELDHDLFEPDNSTPGDHSISAISVQHLMDSRPRILADRSQLVMAAANAFRKVMKRLGHYLTTDSVSLQKISAHKVNGFDGSMITGMLQWQVILASHSHRRRKSFTLEMPVVAGKPVEEVTMITSTGVRHPFNIESIDKEMNVRRDNVSTGRGWSRVPVAHHFEY